MLSANLFVTIRFERHRLPLMRAAFDALLVSLPPNTPVFGVWEQRGQNVTESGKDPHLHVILFLRQRHFLKVVQRRIHTLFHSTDVRVVPVTAWRTADLVYRYLDGYKRHGSEGERLTTRRWRDGMRLPQVIDRHDAKGLARRHISQDEYRAIQKRKEQYK